MNNAIDTVEKWLESVLNNDDFLEMIDCWNGELPIDDRFHDAKHKFATDLLSKLNIPEIEEVIGKYQATVLSLNKVNAEKVKLQHQLDNIPEQKTLDRENVWNIVEKLVADETGAVFQEKVIEYTDRIMALIPGVPKMGKTQDKIEELRKHIEFCCIEAQKADFYIWEERREEAEREIKELFTLAQGEVEKGKPSICDEIETEVNKDEQ